MGDWGIWRMVPGCLPSFQPTLPGILGWGRLRHPLVDEGGAAGECSGGLRVLGKLGSPDRSPLPTPSHCRLTGPRN